MRPQVWFESFTFEKFAKLDEEVSPVLLGRAMDKLAIAFKSSAARCDTDIPDGLTKLRSSYASLLARLASK